ncbi:MAG TPA: hypothetical protein VMT71_17585 [Syntrophorhabdales bacterium]|nr:hypothetical protein [Syntrophorhabdales bacterium]
MKRRWLSLLTGVFLFGCGWNIGTPAIEAQTYPNRPIQLVIPGAAGLMQDIPGRVLSEEIGKLIKQQIVVVNKPGASILSYFTFEKTGSTADTGITNNGLRRGS